MLKLKWIGILFVISISACRAQGKNADSLRIILQSTLEPVERFSVINELMLSEVQFAGHYVDSSYCMQSLQIAQQLKNDSLLAITYNHLGSYFSFNKGDFATGLEFYFKGIPLAESVKDKRRISSLYFDIAEVYSILQNYEEAAKNNKKGLKNLPEPSSPLYNFMLVQYQRNTIDNFLATNQPDSALNILSLYDKTIQSLSGVLYEYMSMYFKGTVHAMKGDSIAAEKYFRLCIDLHHTMQANDSKFNFYKYYIPFLLSANRIEEALVQSRQVLEVARLSQNKNMVVVGAKYLRLVFDRLNQVDSAYYYSRMEAELNEKIFSQANKSKIQSFAFSEQIRLIEEKTRIDSYRNQLRQNILLFGLVIILIIAFIVYRNNRQKQKANKVLEATLVNLKSTQAQLIQSEKMVSLGELTAGIAHEIQNPLNFVNNFSEVSNELIKEIQDIRHKTQDQGNITEEDEILNDIASNLEKINHHGKRAADIVKGMLQHSRSSSGVKEPTNINALADEYLRLAYHGLKAKDKSFNATIKTEFDASIGNINVIPQDIGRVILNLITNAFYTVSEKQKADGEKSSYAKASEDKYEPTVSVITKKTGDKVLISVKDNGSGIPQKVLDKIFQPFYTTKPTGQGTGLGLSLSYDIVKAHGGEIKVNTKENEGTEFTIHLPIS